MTATLDLTTIIAMLVASFYRYGALPTLVFQASQIAMSASSPPPSKPLFGYVTSFAQPLL